jgi:hypothetical protein
VGDKETLRYKKKKRTMGDKNIKGTKTMRETVGDKTMGVNGRH